LEKVAGSDFYRKLSPQRRIALVLVLGVLAIATLFSLFSGSQPSSRASSSADTKDGATPPRKDAADLAGPLNGDWPYKSGSLIETQGQLEAKLLNYHRLRMEQAILWNKNIEKVTIGLAHSPSPSYVGERSGGNSAAVVLQLATGVTMLSRAEADSIRGMVSSAFNLKPERVSISDNGGRSYPPASGGAVPLDIQAEEDRYRTEIQGVVQGHFRPAFREDEFYVGVIVSLSTQRSSVEREEVDRDKTFTRPTRTEYLKEDERPVKDDPSTGGILSPERSHHAIIHETTEEKPFASIEKTKIDIPPGQVKAVSVNVLLDLEAVERILGKEPFRRPSLPREQGGLASGSTLGQGRAVVSGMEREESIKDYEKRQEDVLGKLLSPMVASSVCVMVHPFSRTEAPVGPKAPSLAATGPAFPETGSAWLPPSWKAILGISAMALLLFSLLAVLLSHIKQSWPGRGLDPAYALPGRSGGLGEDSARQAFRRERSSAGSLQDGILRSVSDISTLVRKRPDVAASVLRFWLSQDRGGGSDKDKDDGKNGGGRA
jgi:hypothetical protein